MDQNEPPVLENPVLPQKKSSLKIVLLLLAVVLLVTVGVYAGMQLGKKQTTPSQIISQPTLTPTETPADETVYTEQSRTANWKTYTNEKYEYEFKYPQNWEINRTLGSPPELSDKQLSQLGYVSIYNPQTTALDNGDNISFSADWGHPDMSSSKVRLIPITCTDITSTTCLEQIFSGGIPKYTKDIIATYPAIRVGISDIYILNKNKIFFINLSVGNEGRKKQTTEVFDQILSTFKFVDSGSVNIDKDEAVELVKSLDSVKDYLTRVPNGIVDFDHESEDKTKWVIHVYEVVRDHTATFNWFNVNKVTGEIEPEF